MLLNVGFDNAVASLRVIAIVSVNSAPVRRMIEEASKRGFLIDATHGKKMKSCVITDSGHCVVSAIQSETLMSRFEGVKAAEKKAKDRESDKK